MEPTRPTQERPIKAERASVGAVWGGNLGEGGGLRNRDGSRADPFSWGIWGLAKFFHHEQAGWVRQAFQLLSHGAWLIDVTRGPTQPSSSQHRAWFAVTCPMICRLETSFDITCLLGGCFDRAIFSSLCAHRGPAFGFQQSYRDHTESLEQY